MAAKSFKINIGRGCECAGEIFELRFGRCGAHAPCSLFGCCEYNAVGDGARRINLQESLFVRPPKKSPCLQLKFQN